MKAFTTHSGLVVPVDRANIDTDMIIPKQFLKSIKRSGFGPNLFDELRYLDLGEIGQDPSERKINPQFSLNQARYQGASVLLARENFGCGSSREHAPWALDDFGIRVIIAPSFADIFYNNCFKNGLLPITLDESIVDAMFTDVDRSEGYSVEVDLQSQRVSLADGSVHRFEIDLFRKQCLLEGFDEIGVTLAEADKIQAFEAQYYNNQPWLAN